MLGRELKDVGKEVGTDSPIAAIIDSKYTALQSTVEMSAIYPKAADCGEDSG